MLIANTDGEWPPTPGEEAFGRYTYCAVALIKINSLIAFIDKAQNTDQLQRSFVGQTLGLWCLAECLSN